MNIQHEPLFDTAKIEAHYTEKDDVEVKYVCTSALGAQEFATDIFYRATPHPQFGNRYFAIYRNMYAAGAQIMITNADKIEDLDFGMIRVDGKYYYSQHRHDYKVIGDKMIDGGRAYIRSSGVDLVMRVKDGKFYASDVQDLVAQGDEQEYVYPGGDCQV